MTICPICDKNSDFVEGGNIFVLSAADLNQKTGQIDMKQGKGIPVLAKVCAKCGHIELRHAIPQLLNSK